MNARKRLCWSLSAGNQDEPSLGFDSLYEKDVPDFDDIVLDDDFYKVKTLRMALSHVLIP